MRRLRGYLLLVLLASPVGGAASDTAEPRQLLARSLSAAPPLPLSATDQRWLARHRTLLLGTATPDYPPFDLNLSLRDYEGLSADYAGLLAEQLGVDLQVRRFDSRQAAIEALRRGQIDLLGGANGYEVGDAPLSLSQAYADDLPVVVTRLDGLPGAQSNLAGRRLAMVDHYLPPSRIQTLYPKAQLTLYPSTLAGLNALAQGEVDAYIGDAISSDYMIGHVYQGLVRIDHFIPIPAGGFAFAMANDDPTLLRLVDQALDRISDSERLNILRRWTSGNTSLLLQRQLSNLTAEELDWIRNHPTVNVLLNPNLAPITFNDRDGNPGGITVEVLKQIGLRTGLRFVIHERDSVPAMIDEVARGEADMAGAVDYGPRRLARVLYTRPYLSAPRVMVMRTQAHRPATLDQQRVALVQDASQHTDLIARYPQAQVVPVDNALAMLEAVANGKADVALMSHTAAQYYLTHVFKDRLRIVGLQDEAPVVAAFAVTPDKMRLQSILEKALISIPPDELDQLVNRWRTSTLVSDSEWANYRSLTLQVLILSSLLLAGAVFWNRYLRRLIRQRSEAQRALQAQLALSSGLLEQLRVARDAAERASQAKSSFLAIMSHEIRTPMNAVIGLLEMALEDSRQHRNDPQALQVAHDSALGLLDLIGDVLDISRIESGHMTLHPVPADLVALVRGTVRVFEGSAALKGLTLVAEVPDAPTWGLVDAVRLRQVLSNLLSNALKFTERGQVKVSLRVTAGAEGLGLHLQVQDSGPGIDAADQARLFNSFTQLDDSPGRQGAGLGLVISRTLCRLMGGDLRLHSTPGTGTRVVVQLTLENATPPDVDRTETPSAHGDALRVLVVDDYPANIMLLEKQLHSLGHQVQTAEHGEAALSLWRQGDIDVVLTDCSMPVMDGHALTRHIRDEEQRSGRPPCRIIGITANAQAEERARCLASGMDECLFKPIGLQALKSRLPPARPVTPPAAPPVDAVDAARPESGFDLAQLRHLTQDDVQLTRRLLDQLAHSTAEDLAALRGLPPEADAAQLRPLVHRIKGGARMLKVRGIVRDCEHVEQASAEGLPTAAACARLQANLEGLEQQLRASLTALEGSR